MVQRFSITWGYLSRGSTKHAVLHPEGVRVVDQVAVCQNGPQSGRSWLLHKDGLRRRQKCAKCVLSLDLAGR